MSGYQGGGGIETDSHVSADLLKGSLKSSRMETDTHVSVDLLRGSLKNSMMETDTHISADVLKGPEGSKMETDTHISQDVLEGGTEHSFRSAPMEISTSSNFGFSGVPILNLGQRQGLEESDCRLEMKRKGGDEKMEEEWCCDWCEEQKNHLLRQIGELQNSLNQVNQNYGQRVRQLEFLFQRMANQFGTLDQEFVNQTDNAQTIAKFYEMQEIQNARWATFENDLKNAFVRFYEKIQNEMSVKVAAMNMNSPPSLSINPALDAATQQPGLSEKLPERAVHLSAHNEPETLQPRPSIYSENNPIENVRFERERTIPASFFEKKDDISSAMLSPEKEITTETPMVSFLEGQPTGGKSCTIAQVGFAPTARGVQSSFAPQQQIPVAFASTPIQAHMANRAKKLCLQGYQVITKRFVKILNFFGNHLGVRLPRMTVRSYMFLKTA